MLLSIVGCFCCTLLLQNLTLEELNEMSTTSKEDYWLELITQCRSSGLTDRQWCLENRIPVSTFYYHVRALRKMIITVRRGSSAYFGIYLLGRYMSFASNNCRLHRPYIVRFIIFNLLFVPLYITRE